MNQQRPRLCSEPARRHRRLVTAGLVLLGLALVACGSQQASPSVAHVARTPTTKAGSPTSALVLATQCLRQHGLPNLPGPILATAGPAEGNMVLDKQALATYPRAEVSQALGACTTSLEQAGLDGGSNSGASSQEIRYLLAFAHCVRNHGVPNFPDPNSSGQIPKVSQQELNRPQFREAEKACQNLLPAGTDDMFAPGEVQQLLIGMLRFSQCMRSHDVPNWPDPTTDSEGRPEFPLEEVPDTNRSYWRQPRIAHVESECQYLLPSALGGVPIG